MGIYPLRADITQRGARALRAAWAEDLATYWSLIERNVTLWRAVWAYESDCGYLPFLTPADATQVNTEELPAL